MPQLPLPCLTLVTDRWLCPDGSLVNRVEQAVAGGVEVVQLREKDLSPAAVLLLAQELREAIADKALLLINGQVEVALACGADGVQLGEEGLSVAEARHRVGPQLLLGCSVHSLEGAVAAQANGADFLVMGTIFPSRSHPQEEPAGPDLLRQVRRAVVIPILGIGGITRGNIAMVMDVGADGVAVIQAILAAQDPAQAARELRSAMLSAWETQGLVEEQLA